MDRHRKAIRCAIYTRKSTEDGLEQEYNSLDAQYDACAAYALSQRHEGWTIIANRYDDGGFSGGNMERPGLKQLMADVAAGKVDTILLYKIDRLTRSLSDFARIVEILDKAGASFVSITQSFNTTTSMGRLTLNMLLSFAQFEREVTGERIRDKIAASKRKGIWMGGTVPLGYNVRERRLVINEHEAELVRHIMTRYIALGSVNELIEELARENYRTKIQSNASGPHKGGCMFGRGTLYHLLTNRIYRGFIVHKGEAFPGEHEAIVPEGLWNDVQTTLADRSTGGAKSRVKHLSLLTGKLVDGLGRRMTPSHAQSRKHRYRYYVTRTEAVSDNAAWRVSAVDIETMVIGEVEKLLSSRSQLHNMLQPKQRTPETLKRVFAASVIIAAKLRSGATVERQEILQAIISTVRLGETSMTTTISYARLMVLLGVDSPVDGDLSFNCPVARARKGHELRLIIPPEARVEESVPIGSRSDKVTRLLAEAQSVRELLLVEPETAISVIAAREGKCRTHMARMLQISFLAPQIVKKIFGGELSATKGQLLAVDLPLDWADQLSMVASGDAAKKQLSAQNRRLLADLPEIAASW